MGSLFSVCSKLYFKKTGSDDESHSVGYIYLLEAVGAGASGLLISFILLKYFSTFSIILFVIIINLLAVLNYILNHKKKIVNVLFPQSKLIFINILIYTLILFFIFKGSFEKLDKISTNLKWENYKVTETINSLYGNITMLEVENNYHFYNNGLLMFSYPDFFNSEVSVHFAMLQNPASKNVLMVGGGLNGSLLELLKYKNVQNIDYVELDPQLINLAKKYLPKKLFDNNKINFHFGDGRYFIKTSEQKYDMVIIDLPNPYTIQLNRFYTVQFFKEVKKILKPGGIFSCRISAAENYISEPTKEFLRSIYIPLKFIFKRTLVIPGESAVLIARRGKEELKSSPNELIEIIKEENLKNDLVTESYLKYRMSDERMNFIMEKLETGESVIVNTDLNPIAYYFDMVLWSTHFSKTLRNIFLTIEDLNFKLIFLLLVILLYIIFIYFYMRKKKEDKKSLYLAIFIAGFAGISLELIILLLFQVLYGYLYYQIAIIVSSYMVGIGLGSYLTLRKEYSINQLLYIQLGFAVVPLVILVFFVVLSVTTLSVSFFIGKNIIFTMFAVITGGLTGGHFVLSNKIYKVREKKADWGKVYAIDLSGAAAGAILVSTILIPLFGLKFVIIALIGLNLFAALILGLSYKR